MPTCAYQLPELPRPDDEPPPLEPELELELERCLRGMVLVYERVLLQCSQCSVTSARPLLW